MDADLIKIIVTGIICPVVALVAKHLLDKRSDARGLLENVSCYKMRLTEHPFFERMKCIRTHIENSFELANKGKEAVFKDILINKFNIVIEEYWKMAEELDRKQNDISETELYNILIFHICEEIRRHSHYYVSSAYTQDEQQCIEKVMQKFNKWHSTRMEMVFHTIQNVCASRFYSGILIKSSVALDVLLGQFVEVVNDSEMAFNELNGDLKGLTFKNIKL